MLGEVGPGRLHLEPVARFANTPVRTPDGLHWDVLGLYAEALAGPAPRLSAVGGRGPSPASAIDSWAVDYGLLRDGRLLGTPYHYRDERRCAVGPELVHAGCTPTTSSGATACSSCPSTPSTSSPPTRGSTTPTGCCWCPTCSATG